MSKEQATQFIQEGIAAAKAGETARARSAFQRAIDLHPQSATAWMWAAGVAATPAAAVKMLERVIQLDPDNAAARAAVKAARFEAGMAALRANSRGEARSWLRMVCAGDPKNEAAWICLARATDHPDEAIRHLERVLRLNPNNEKARAGIAQLRARAAIKWQCPICLAKADTLETVCPECRAVLNLSLGDAAIGNPNPNVPRIRKAVDRLSDQVKARPEFETHYFLGMALLNLGKPEQALPHFRECCAMRPDDKNLAAHVVLLERAIEDAAGPTHPMPPEAAEKPDRPGKSVLVVDDSATMRKLVGITMHKNGYRVVEAQDGREALEVIASHGVPDLVVADVIMPGMDGYALCRVIRDNPATANVPVVMMSAREGCPDGANGRTAGVNAYLPKPFEPAALVRVVREFCRPDAVAVPAGVD